MKSLYFFLAFYNFAILDTRILGKVPINPYEKRLEDAKKILEKEKDEKKIFSSDEAEKAFLDYKIKEKSAHYPYHVFTKPKFFSLGCEFAEILNPISKNGKISLDDLNPYFLNSLDKKDFALLMRGLSAKSLKIAWQDKKGKFRSGKKFLNKHVAFSKYEDSNGAFAVALNTYTKKDLDLLSRLIVVAPDAISLGIKKEAGVILDAQTVAKSLLRIIEKIKDENIPKIASSTESIVQVYIKYWAKKDSDLLTTSLGKLIFETSKMMQGKNYTPEQKGILLGVLLAGSLRHAQNITSNDQKKLWAINSISNIVWAATIYLQAIPMANSAAAALIGTLSVAVVVWAVVHNKIGVRDFSPKIREIEGHIEIKALSAAKLKGISCKVEMLETLAYMRAAIHLNGLFD